MRARGHRVVLVINRAMLPWAAKSGLETVTLTDVDRGAEEARENAWAWDHWNNPEPPQRPGGPGAEHETLARQAQEIAEICRGADLLLASAIRPQGLIAQRATGIPWLTLSMNPFVFAPPLNGYERDLELAANVEMYRFFREMIAPAFRRLGITAPLPECSSTFRYARHVILASSVHFSRPDPDQLQPRHSLDLTGFWFYDDPDWDNWRPDPELEAFCARRPLVLAFSSQPLADPRAALALHVEAAALLGMPLLVQRGWAGFTEEALPPGTDRGEVLFRDFLPHDWVFARAACAIQHGGIGTIARALRQGCPILVEPYGNDQVYNARRVHELGVGAAVHPFKVPARGLADVLATRVLVPEARRRAERIGKGLAAEDGIARACALVEDFLRAPDHHEERPRWRVPSLVERAGGGRRPPVAPKLPGNITGTGAISGRIDIPATLHHFPADPEPDGTAASWVHTWREHHPDWEHRIWEAAAVRELIRREYAWFLPVYDAYPEPVQRREAARCFVLHRYGGACTDPGLECLRPIGPLLAGAWLVLGLEPELHRVRAAGRRPELRWLAGTSFMASVPGHPFWEHLARELERSRDAADPADSAGPILLTRACGSWPRREEISLAAAELLAPIADDECWDRLSADVRRQLGAQAFAVNHWRGGWWHADFFAPARTAAVTILERGHDGGTRHQPLDEVLERHRRSPSHPLVSCLMVTRDRAELARRSIRCFLRQEYPACELVIVEDGADRSLEQWVRELAEPRIKHLRLPDDRLALGQLRNRAVEAAAGELVAQWDDDDLSHPQRLALQVAVLADSGAEAALLERQIIWWPERRRLAVSSRRTWEGSFLARKAILAPYPPRRHGEDTPVVEALLRERRVALLDAPWLFVYCCHGGNTFSAAHWQNLWKISTYQCPDEKYDQAAGALLARLGLDAGVQEPERSSSSGPSWAKSE
ncbi:MAG: glycosyltransferase [Candidatus Methylomirabilia bacterium]